MKDGKSNSVLSDSLSIFAERVGDPYSKVYEQFFEVHEEYHDLFFLDTNGDVRGQMLSEALQILMDTEEGIVRAQTMFLAARFAHDGYGVKAEDFLSFFGIIRDIIRQELGEDWSDDFEIAWDCTLKKLKAF